MCVRVLLCAQTFICKCVVVCLGVKAREKKMTNRTATEYWNIRKRHDVVFPNNQESKKGFSKKYA